MPRLQKMDTTPLKDSKNSKLCRDCGTEYQPRHQYTQGRCPKCMAVFVAQEANRRKAEEAAAIMGERKNRRESIGIPARFLDRDFSNYEHKLAFQDKAFKECYRYACLSEDTEVLTHDGWKDWEALHISSKCDKIVVYDSQKETYLFEVPSLWHAYRIREDMFRIKSENTDQLVSRNHRVYTKDGLVLAQSLGAKTDMVYLPEMPADIQCIPLKNRERKEKYWNLLLNKLSTESKHKEVSLSEWQTQAPNVRERETQAPRGNEWRKQSRVERWRNILQNAWQLYWGEICAVSRGIQGYGAQRWLCYGTPLSDGEAIRTPIIENRSGTSQRPRPIQQQSRESLACEFQWRPQALRGEQAHSTTTATVAREFYQGTIYCPTVSTGCFVARRNGKIFLTGNSEFPLDKSVGYRSLYMYSEATKEHVGNGVGKTHLSAAIAHRILDRCNSQPFPRIHWVNEPELIARLRATINYTPEERKYRQTYEDIIHECFHCNLLIVDDVGKEKPKDLSYTQQAMFAIINYRYNNNYPMVITANLNPKNLKVHLGTGTDEASFDRFFEMIEGKMLAIAGPSYRRK